MSALQQSVACSRRRRLDDIRRRTRVTAAAYGITGIYFTALNFGKRGTRAESVAVAGNNILHRFYIIEDEDDAAEKKVRKESGGRGGGKGHGRQRPPGVRSARGKVYRKREREREGGQMLLSPWPDWIYTQKVTAAGRDAASSVLGDKTYEEAERGEAALQNSPDLDCNDGEATPRWVGCRVRARGS